MTSKVLVDASVFVAVFDATSLNRAVSTELLEELSKRGISLAMPAHGWFEVQCTAQRLSEINKSFVGSAILGQMNYPMELIHIDKLFLEKYSMAKIPYIKAGDHIYLAVATIDKLPLVTTDNKILEVGKKCSAKVYTPAEFLAELRSPAKEVDSQP